MSETLRRDPSGGHDDPAPRASTGPAAEPIELSEASSSSPLRWILPAAAIVVAVVFGIRRSRR